MNLSILRDKISECFGDSELRILCDDLGVDYDDLRGSNKIEKIAELVKHFQRRSMLPLLLTKLQQERPKAFSKYQLPLQNATPKLLSDALYEPLHKASVAGNLAIVFLLLGAGMMLSAFYLPHGAGTVIVLFAGFMLIVLVSVLFYLKEIRPLLRVQQNIQQNKELINAIQHTAVEMTALASDFQLLSFRYANQVATVMQDIRPVLQRIPMLRKYADSKTLVDADAISLSVVEYTTRAQDVIDDVKIALITSDTTELEKYIEDVRELRGIVEMYLVRTDSTSDIGG